MKNTIFSVLLISFLYIQGINAQCTVNAGPDLAFCKNNVGNIASSPIAAVYTGNNGIVSITWQGYYDAGIEILTASDYLIDTTTLNPSFLPTFYAGNNNPILFWITVVDSLGLTCSDTMTVRVSNFAALTIGNYITINQGDTATLQRYLFQGIPPTYITWSPNYNMSDSTAANPRVWPDTTMMYYHTITDSIGCTAVGPWHVIVQPVAVNKISNELKVQIFPNPGAQEMLLWIDKTTVDISLVLNVYDASGKLLHAIKNIPNPYSLGSLNLKAGLYYYQIKDKDEQSIASGSFIRN